MRSPLAHPLGLALAAAALIAVGCGGDDDETTTAADTTTAETTTEAEPDGGGGDGAPPPGDVEVTELTSFSSPDGNIGCLIDRESVRCDIAERDWKPPPKPADCDLDYGQGLTINAGGAPELVCAGDTALNATTSGAPLPYGQSITAGLLRCETEKSGMRCRDTETGRGFKLSRQSYELL